MPKKAMDEIKSLLDSTDVEAIEFAKDESTLFFRIGPRLLTSRQLTGQFPNYEAVLPKDNNKSVTVNCEDLSGAIQRVAQFADERSRAVRMKIEKGELKISAAPTETGESEDSIETSYNGDSVTIGSNAAYLLDFLKATGSGEVRMEFKDAQSAGQLRPAEGEEYKYRYIVMPMRICNRPCFMHLFYIDESYDQVKFVLSSLRVDAASWKDVLGKVKRFRAELRS